MRSIATDVEEQGYDAGYQGYLHQDDNPYDLHSEEWYEWRRGYVDGESDWENSDVGYET